ncbi:MAG: dihydroorotate dehydrogenase (quinone) [Candidatus Ancillula sp.]|jgi:dihydroorotate dehydrogenase (fumarate)|nr:dihydroorotate dehydrogenase (quinone) [Candidatus Ancillula sp.]
MRYFLQGCALFFYKHLVKPILFKIKPDKMHDLMIKFASWAGRNRLFSWFIKYSMTFENEEMLGQKLDNFGGLYFRNPIGLGAGFDKNAVTASPIERIGFSYAAFGSTTGRMCPGNPRPWFHRLPEYKSLMINVGLANEGVDVVAKTVSSANSVSKTLNVGQSIARTNDKIAADDKEGIQDYVYSLQKLNGKTAFIEVNISCPNTFKGEPFTDEKRLDQLLTELDKVNPSQPITLKMPSDKSWEDFKSLLEVAIRHNVQGVTIANLRKDRVGMEIPDDWKGNLSGKPTWDRSNYLVAKTYLEYGDKLTIMGLGGVFTAEDAYQKIKAGADLVSVVTALMFEGPAAVPSIKRGLVKLLKQDGYLNISEARGVEAEKIANKEI